MMSSDVLGLCGTNVDCVFQIASFESHLPEIILLTQLPPDEFAVSGIE